MFDTTLLDQDTFDPSVKSSDSLTSTSAGASGIDPFLSSTSHHETALSSGFDVEFVNQSLAQAGTSNSIAATSSSPNAAVEALAAGANSDALTGISAQNSFAGATASASGFGTRIIQGNLRANRFTLQYGFNSNYVFSGNGNVDFGRGGRDFIDLSNISQRAVVNYNFASSTGGGVSLNLGNGSRVFDAMTLSNGARIFFEGIEDIRFSEGFIDFAKYDKFVTPNDPKFNQQWNLHMMGVHNAWRFTKGSTNVLIGVQDTGLGVNSSGIIHPDLRSTTIYQNNYQDDFSGGINSTSHGTGVQGIIAAKTNNGVGMSGINWNSQVFNIDVLGGNQNDQTLDRAAIKYD